MELQELIDDIEAVCKTCETCEPTCACNTFKECIAGQIELESALKQSFCEYGV